MRQFIDLVEQSLTEGGIKTAPLDRLAREALRTAIAAFVSEKINEAKQHFDLDEEDDEYWSKLYDAVDDHYGHQSRRDAVLNELCLKLSATLTKVTRNYVQTLDLPNPVTSPVLVSVEVKEGSKDYYADRTVGYYAHIDRFIKVFLPKSSLFDAFMEMIQENIFGESERGGYNATLTILIPTFIHEYAHFEQNHRQRNGGDSDFGYITAGGKRGGIMRSPQKSVIDRLRYYGSVDEIDAHAANTASELIDELEQSRNFGLRDDEIKSLQDSIGRDYWRGSPTLDHYRTLLQDAFDGRYADIGLKPEEMRKVWKRFMKRVSERIGDYRREKAGRKGAERASFKPERLAVIEGKSLKDAVKAMVEVAAKEIRADYDFHPKDELIEKVREDRGLMLWDFVEPLRRYFFDEWSENDHPEKMARLFKDLLIRQMEKNP